MKRFCLALVVALCTAPVSAQSPSAIDTLDQIDVLLKQLRATLAPHVPPAPTITQIPSGADLTAAIKAAVPCALLQLAPNGTYGPFIASQCVTLLGAPVTSRVSPQMLFPKVHGLDRLLTIPKGVSGVTVQGIEFAGEGGGADLIVTEGSTVDFDGLYIHGDPVLGQKRGIALQGDHATVQRSYISDIKRTGQDTQAIAGWDGAGPFTIRDNYLEASGENVFFGGADPTTLNLVPSDILIADNTITKPIGWKGLWLVKNLIELKNARRAVITNNDLSNSWVSGQGGYAIALTVRNQDGHCPWCTLEHIEVSSNRLAHANGFVNILGRDDEKPPSGIMDDVAIVDNVMTDLNTSAFGTVDNAARAILIQGGPSNLRIERNTVTSGGLKAPNSFLVFGQPQWKLTGFVFRGNTMPQGGYGIVGDTAAGFGIPALDLFAPGAIFEANTVVKTGTAKATIKYPVGTIVQ